MLTCPNCNKELSEGTKFCDGCGTPIVQQSVEQSAEQFVCSNCGKAFDAPVAFCDSCGATLVAQPAEAPKEKKKLPKKALLFGGIGAAAVALIAIVVVVISLFAGGSKENNFALYLKDEEIFFNELKKNSEAWQVTSRLVDTNDVTSEDLAESGYAMAYLTYISEDGKYIFFPDKIGDGDGINLYYRELGKTKVEAVKIDTEVISYWVNEDTTVVTYLKGEDRNLYQYKLKGEEKEKIAGDVRSYQVSEDGAKILYMNTEGSVYLKDGKKDKEKLVSEISTLEYISDDFKTLYYVKDETLYKQVVGKDREKIAEDIYDVIKIYESGEIYFLTDESVEETLMSYVQDDMASADASVTQPVYPTMPKSPTRPYSWNYDVYEEYEAAKAAYEIAYEEWEEECDRLREAYNEAREKYNEKLDRDSMRESLQENTFTNTKYTLHFFDGKKDNVITESFVRYSNTTAQDAPVITYTAYKQSAVEEFKLSQLDSVYDVENKVREALFTQRERFLTVKTNAKVIDQETTAEGFTFNESGTVVYYLDEVDEENSHGKLYRITIKDGAAGKPELYDSDVYAGYDRFIDDEQYLYYKDYKDYKGELYIDKKRVDYDVYVSNVSANAEEDRLIYFTDWNSEKSYGTLKIYQDGKATKIADDVHTFSVIPDGRILYLSDYSMNHYKGALNEWKNGKIRKIDDDVVALIPIVSTSYRASLFG